MSYERSEESDLCVSCSGEVRTGLFPLLDCTRSNWGGCADCQWTTRVLSEVIPCHVSICVGFSSAIRFSDCFRSSKSVVHGDVYQWSNGGCPIGELRVVGVDHIDASFQALRKSKVKYFSLDYSV